MRSLQLFLKPVGDHYVSPVSCPDLPQGFSYIGFACGWPAECRTQLAVLCLSTKLAFASGQMWPM